MLSAMWTLQVALCKTTYLLVIFFFISVSSMKMFRGMVFTSVCLSVYLHDISKTTKARITKLDREMFHHESWKLIYFGVRKSKVQKTITRHKIQCLHEILLEIYCSICQ